MKNAKPHLLENSIKINETAQARIDDYRKRADMLDYSKEVGVVESRLTCCNAAESDLGNAITDSMVDFGGWEDATIGIMNNGGIR